LEHHHRGKSEYGRRTTRTKEFEGNGNYPVAVLLEGKFHSVLKIEFWRLKKLVFQIGKDSKMIVISDGDVIKNQFDKNYHR
jgi:hypothetical protein